MRLADMDEADRLGFVDNEGGGIGGFAFGIPTKTVGAGKRIIRIDHEEEVFGPIFVTEEFLRVSLEVLGRARIDHQDFGAGRCEFGGMRDEVMHLARAKRALIPRPAAHDDENHR